MKKKKKSPFTPVYIEFYIPRWFQPHSTMIRTAISILMHTGCSSISSALLLYACPHFFSFLFFLVFFFFPFFFLKSTLFMADISSEIWRSRTWPMQAPRHSYTYIYSIYVCFKVVVLCRGFSTTSETTSWPTGWKIYRRVSAFLLSLSL